MSKTRKIHVNETEISVILKDETDYISLTDMTKGFQEGSGLIGKWITNKNTLEYLGTWERISNPAFNYPEFGVIESAAGVNRFINEGMEQAERLKKLNRIAIEQMQILTSDRNLKRLEGGKA